MKATEELLLSLALAWQTGNITRAIVPKTFVQLKLNPKASQPNLSKSIARQRQFPSWQRAPRLKLRTQTGMANSPGARRRLLLHRRRRVLGEGSTKGQGLLQLSAPMVGSQKIFREVRGSLALSQCCACCKHLTLSRPCCVAVMLGGIGDRSCSRAAASSCTDADTLQCIDNLRSLRTVSQTVVPQV